MGPWSTIPFRLRLAFVTLVAGAASIGVLAGLDLLSLAASVFLLSGMSMLWMVIFDRRRPWWQSEPGLVADPVARGAARNIAVALIATTATAGLVLLGVLDL